MKNGMKGLVLAAALAVSLCACTAGTISPTIKTYTRLTETQRDTLTQTALPRGSMYLQTACYQKPYFFIIGWNINTPVTSKYVGKTVTLGDGETLKVYFSDACADSRNDRATMAALNTLLTQMVAERKASGQQVGWPLVVEAEYMGDASVEEVAAQAYQDERLTLFSAVVEQLDAKTQQEYLKQIVADKRVAFLGSSLDKVQVNAEQLESYAEQAYQQGSIAVFSVLVDYMDDGQRQSWAERAAAEGKRKFASIAGW